MRGKEILRAERDVALAEAQQKGDAFTTATVALDYARKIRETIEKEHDAGRATVGELNDAFQGEIRARTALDESMKPRDDVGAQSARSPYFGPAVERVLPLNSKGVTDFFDLDSEEIVEGLTNTSVFAFPVFDLDSGKLIRGRTNDASGQRITDDTAELQESLNSRALISFAPAARTVTGNSGVALQTAEAGAWDSFTRERVKTEAERIPFSSVLNNRKSLWSDRLPQNFLFKTLHGKMGMLQISALTDNPPGVKIRYKFLGEQPWGEPVNGLKSSLQPLKSVWRSDEAPILLASLRNEGEMELATSRISSDLQQVEVDGNWYRSRITQYESGTNEQGLVMLRGATFQLNWLKPGEQWNDVPIFLRKGEWQRATTNDLALATYPFRNYINMDTEIAPVLWLSTGKHAVRVAFIVGPTGAFRVISNPVEVEIQSVTNQLFRR